MNDVRQIWLVAVREVRERGRSRAFLIALVLMLVTVAGAIALPALLDAGADTKQVGLTGTVPAELAAALQGQGEAVDTTIRIQHYDTVAAGEQAIRDGAVDVLVIDGRRLEWQGPADEQLQTVVTGAIQSVAIRERAAAAGISPDQLAEVVAPVPVNNVELGQVAGRSPGDETAAFVITLVLFFAISTYGAMVMSGVVEEKSSRTVEVLLARTSSRNLLAGKIVGIGLLGLAQITAAAIVALVAETMVDAVDLAAVSGSVIAWAVVWFVLGYTLYATLFGTLGSLASRTEDASAASGPVTVILVLGFLISFATIGSAATTWARLVSWFPLTAPIAMPNRIAMGAASWWDPLVAVALTLAAIVGLVVLGGRVYTRAILHTGATLTVGQAWRGAPVPTPAALNTPDRHLVTETSPQHGPATGATTAKTNESLTQAILIGLSVALGGAVFAFTRDFVIGAAVAAAFYALARRVVKAKEHARR
jgi:ABC-2 type transport system permease protein